MPGPTRGAFATTSTRCHGADTLADGGSSNLAFGERPLAFSDAVRPITTTPLLVNQQFVGLIERHGGTIRVASQPGRTTFTVLLPQSSAL